MYTDHPPLLDTQPALPQVLATTTDAATTRYVHNPLGGILSQHDAAGAWHWALVDGLGSVRGMVDEAGSVTLPFAFTGEPRDGNGPSPIAWAFVKNPHHPPAAGIML